MTIPTKREKLDHWKELRKKALSINRDFIFEGDDYSAFRYKQSYQNRKARYQSDPQFRKSIEERTKKFMEKNPEKIKGYLKKYYEKNKEKIKAYSKLYNLENKEKIRAASKEYYKKNNERIKEYSKERSKLKKRVVNISSQKDPLFRDKINEQIRTKYKIDPKFRKLTLERTKAYVQRNPDKLKAYRKKYYENNREKLKNMSNEYYKNNREKIKEYYKNYKGKVQLDSQ